MADWMIDTETLGLAEDAAVVALALVKFDRATGAILKEGVFYFGVEEAMTIPGATIAPSTLLWWLAQDRDVMTKMWKGVDEYIHSIEYAIEYMQTEINECDHIWAQHSLFDFPKVERLFIKTGQVIPWVWYKRRDVPSIVELTGCRDEVKELIGRSALHDPLQDCKDQVLAVKTAYGKLCFNREAPSEYSLLAQKAKLEEITGEVRKVEMSPALGTGCKGAV